MRPPRAGWSEQRRRRHHPPAFPEPDRREPLPPAEVDLNVVHSEDYEGELDDPHTREEEFVRNLVETLDATEEELFRFGRAVDSAPELQMALTDPAQSASTKAALRLPEAAPLMCRSPA